MIIIELKQKVEQEPDIPAILLELGKAYVNSQLGRYKMSVEYKTQIELQQQLEEIILKLHQKYAFDFEVIQNLAKDISESLFARSEPGTEKENDDNFDIILQKVAETLEKLIHDVNPTVGFQTFKAQVKRLASETKGQPSLRRQMTALLATATRRINSSELTKEQLRVLQEIVKRLKGTISDFEEIMECERLLEQVNVNVLPNLGYGAEVWARLVKDEDIFGDIDSDTAFTPHE